LAVYETILTVSFTIHSSRSMYCKICLINIWLPLLSITLTTLFVSWFSVPDKNMRICNASMILPRIFCYVTLSCFYTRYTEDNFQWDSTMPTVYWRHKSMPLALLGVAGSFLVVSDALESIYQDLGFSPWSANNQWA